MYFSERISLNHSIMKPILIAGLWLTAVLSNAQTSTPSGNIIEGGKMLIELVKIFRNPPSRRQLTGKGDQLSDICFKNSTVGDLYIQLLKKLNDTTYKDLPVSVSLLSLSRECIMDLVPGVYHYRVFKKDNKAQLLSLEGELRLVPNETMEREIR
jgi:hypothetical protein